jgi:LmbE family N-acetylglucosaminyl deacetylase
MELNKKATVFIPDGEKEDAALKRTDYLAVSAHEDDIEFMAMSPILECFGTHQKWFGAVVMTDGAGSPRSGIYKDVSDEEMVKIRRLEQEKAAFVGEYSFQYILNYPSKVIKDPKERDSIEDLKKIVIAAHPKVIYTHNPADKHDTHIATVLKVIEALRELKPADRPEKLYGCEVWRNLDWMCDEDKIYMDVSTHPNISKALSGVFDSQIQGGKAYDEAADGRRKANATFSASHAVDSYQGLNYAMDLTPLINDPKLDIGLFVGKYIEKFENEVKERLNKLEGK